jgi:hypothetical protein
MPESSPIRNTAAAAAAAAATFAKEEGVPYGNSFSLSHMQIWRGDESTSTGSREGGGGGGEASSSSYMGGNRVLKSGFINGDFFTLLEIYSTFS